jgi:phosphohistidine phosphatase
MKLLIIRHGAAGDAEAFAKTGKPDELRPLTSAGKREMRSVAAGLYRLAGRPAVLVSSRLTRAMQTADIVAEAMGVPADHQTDALAPEAKYRDLANWLRAHDDGLVAAVGHEPHLSGVISWFIAGRDDATIELKKAGAALIEFDGRAKKGKGALLWLMPPSLIAAQAQPRAAG